MLTKVTSFKVVAPFGIEVRFNDGTGGVHDCADLVKEGGPVALPLRAPAYFAKGFLEFGAPTWPNGFDMDAEWLRRQMMAAGELQHNAAAE
jgi:hypothetical protein